MYICIYVHLGSLWSPDMVGRAHFGQESALGPLEKNGTAYSFAGKVRAVKKRERMQ